MGVRVSMYVGEFVCECLDVSGCVGVCMSGCVYVRVGLCDKWVI